MKILYVEDELTKSVERVKDLFGKYLGDDLIMEIEELEDSDYGATKSKLKEIIEKSGVIDVEYRFPEALDKVKNHADEYELLIIDRNLSDSAYTKEEVKRIDSNITDELIEKINSREGDQLLKVYTFDWNRLDEVGARFFFLSAYKPDGIAKDLIERGRFSRDNYIDKTNMDTLIEKINNLKKVGIFIKNKEVLNILKRHGLDDAWKFYVDVAECIEDESNIDSNLVKIRKIQESIFERIVSLDGFPKENNGYPFKDNKDRVLMKNVIYFLQDKVPTAIKQHLYNINDIASKYGAHNLPEGKEGKNFTPSIDTVRALFYELNDVIRFFDGFIAGDYKRYLADYYNK